MYYKEIKSIKTKDFIITYNRLKLGIGLKIISTSKYENNKIYINYNKVYC